MSKLKNKENKNKTEIKNCYTKKGSDSTYALSLYRLLHSTHHHIFFFVWVPPPSRNHLTSVRCPTSQPPPSLSPPTPPSFPLQDSRVQSQNHHHHPVRFHPCCSRFMRASSPLSLSSSSSSHTQMYVCVCEREREREVVVVAYLLRLMKSFMKRMSALNASSDTPL